MTENGRYLQFISQHSAFFVLRRRGVKEAFILLFWWALFGGTHLVLSSALVRPKLIATVGERPFLGLYSLVAFATLIPLCWYYAGHKHADPLLWRTLVALI